MCIYVYICVYESDGGQMLELEVNYDHLSGETVKYRYTLIYLGALQLNGEYVRQQNLEL